LAGNREAHVVQGVVDEKTGFKKRSERRRIPLPRPRWRRPSLDGVQRGGGRAGRSQRRVFSAGLRFHRMHAPTLKRAPGQVGPSIRPRRANGTDAMAGCTGCHNPGRATTAAGRCGGMTKTFNRGRTHSGAQNKMRVEAENTPPWFGIPEACKAASPRDDDRFSRASATRRGAVHRLWPTTTAGTAKPVLVQQGRQLSAGTITHRLGTTTCTET